jgi:hypothetical protein
MILYKQFKCSVAYAGRYIMQLFKSHYLININQQYLIIK